MDFSLTPSVIYGTISSRNYGILASLANSLLIKGGIYDF